MRRRWLIYGVALAGAAALLVFGDATPGGADVVGARTVKAAVASSDAPRRQANADSGSVASAAAGRWVALQPREALWHSHQSRLPVRDLFSTPESKTARKPEVAAPAPPPQAPPMPFTFLGKRQDASQWQVFLGRGDYTFIVQEGSTIESTYRVDTVAPPTLTMTYLPLAQAQTLAIGSAE